MRNDTLKTYFLFHTFFFFDIDLVIGLVRSCSGDFSGDFISTLPASLRLPSTSTALRWTSPKLIQ